MSTTTTAAGPLGLADDDGPEPAQPFEQEEAPRAKSNLVAKIIGFGVILGLVAFLLWGAINIVTLYWQLLSISIFGAKVLGVLSLVTSLLFIFFLGGVAGRLFFPTKLAQEAPATSKIFYWCKKLVAIGVFVAIFLAVPVLIAAQVFVSQANYYKAHPEIHSRWASWFGGSPADPKGGGEKNAAVAPTATPAKAKPTATTQPTATPPRVDDAATEPTPAPTATPKPVAFSTPVPPPANRPQPSPTATPTPAPTASGAADLRLSEMQLGDFNVQDADYPAYARLMKIASPSNRLEKELRLIIFDEPGTYFIQVRTADASHQLLGNRCARIPWDDADTAVLQCGKADGRFEIAKAGNSIGYRFIGIDMANVLLVVVKEK